MSDRDEVGDEMMTEHTLPSGWSRKRSAKGTLLGDATTPLVFENDDGDRRIEVVPTRVETTGDESEWRVRDVHARTTVVLDSASDRATAVEKAIDAMVDTV